MLSNKEEEISTLRMLVDKQQSAISNEDKDGHSKNMLQAMKKERDDLMKQYQKMADDY